MKYIVIFICSMAQLLSSQNQWISLSDNQALILEEKFMKTDFKTAQIEDARALVRYLIDSHKEDIPSLMKKLDKQLECGYNESVLESFYRGIKGYGYFCDLLKKLYAKTNTSLVSPPVVKETRWYDMFFKRPDSGSSSSSKESDSSNGYLEKDLYTCEETEELIEKDKKSKKYD